MRVNRRVYVLSQAWYRTMPRPRKDKAKRRVGLAVYVEPGILRALRRAAENDRRSASMQAALYIENGLGLGKPRRS